MSRVSQAVFDKTFEANADLSASQFCFVKAVAGPAGGVNSRAALCESGRPLGILQNKPSAAGLGSVMRLLGTSKLKVDGSGTTIAAGDPIKATTGGLGVKATANLENVAAVALEASSADGDIIEVFLVSYDISSA